MNIDFCLAEARKIPYVKRQQRHFACVLDKRGRVVSTGINSYVKTSPRAFKAACKVGLPEKSCVHAEMQALFRDKQRRGVKLIVVRVGADNQPMYSAPCNVCAYLIKEHGSIKSIEFSV